MVQVFLWLTITWKNITDKFISAVKMFVSLRTRILCMLLARCDYQHIVAFARILHFCFPARRQDKLLQHVANENRRCLLGEPGTRIDYTWIKNGAGSLSLRLPGAPIARYGINWQRAHKRLMPSSARYMMRVVRWYWRRYIWCLTCWLVLLEAMFIPAKRRLLSLPALSSFHRVTGYQ